MKKEIRQAISRIRKFQDAVYCGKVINCRSVSVHNNSLENIGHWWTVFVHVDAVQEPMPVVKQYEEMKAKHTDAVLLLRVGDFYETYHEDARTTAEVLGITLTRRHDGTNMAGFPRHALDSYLPRLVRAGKRVAICDQLTAPSKEKKEECKSWTFGDDTEPERMEEIFKELSEFASYEV